jgi:hypothetical protein
MSSGSESDSERNGSGGGGLTQEQLTVLGITVMVIITSVVLLFGVRFLVNRSQQSNKANDRKVLKSVYESGGGNNWDIKYSENWCKDDCKLGEWAGVEAGFANGHEHVLELIMRGNRNLTGVDFFSSFLSHSFLCFLCFARCCRRFLPPNLPIDKSGLH